MFKLYLYSLLRFDSPAELMSSLRCSSSTEMLAPVVSRGFCYQASMACFNQQIDKGCVLTLMKVITIQRKLIHSWRKCLLATKVIVCTRHHLDLFLFQQLDMIHQGANFFLLFIHYVLNLANVGLREWGGTATPNFACCLIRSCICEYAPNLNIFS